MWSDSVLLAILLGNISIGLAVGWVVLLFQALQNIFARLALLVGLGILLLILLWCSFAGSIFVMAGFSKDW